MDERRRVAERMRKAAEQGQPYTVPTLACLVEAERADPSSLWHRLADLIDPTCVACPDVEDTPDGGQYECFSCSVCGEIISTDDSYDPETDGPTYCETCGHRIVGMGEPTWE